MSGRHARGRMPQAQLRRPPHSTPAPCPTLSRCEVVALPPDGTPPILLRVYTARSPRLAARWIRQEAHRLAQRLDPDPVAPWVPPTAWVPVGDASAADYLRAWAANDEWYTATIRRIADRTGVQVTVADQGVRYVLLAAPAPIRRAPQYPPATGRRHLPAEVGAANAAHRTTP
ncbi:hypothetical protein [Streptomyces bluensis]|uniref:Uncharacterized protein n=1 Tax=Streptomyces bluensis TaxID=33897 RepID=A0ABW6UJ66_9ACTN